jgi:hypothetical protein
MSDCEILTPFKASSPDSASALRLTLEEGEVAILGSKGLLLAIESGKTPDYFIVKKVDSGSTDISEIDVQAGDWNLLKDSVYLKMIGFEQALLLGPSLLGQSLYGGQIYRGDDGIVKISDPLRVKYGCIHTDFDPKGGGYGINILMPDLPYLGFDKLTLQELT